MAQVIIIHGWSDTSESFESLAELLQDQGNEVAQINLGDYISLDDDVRIEDVAKRMNVVLNERLSDGRLQAPFDMIVHSTGGLVAREWLAELYAVGGSPIRRLIMLAPANHGSHLAAKGKSLIGRVVKGWNNWFETGKEMLNALELASPYQWSLAKKDLLASSEAATSPYGKAHDKVLPFVITGTHPYASGARKLVDENGGDGTIRVPAANLNAQGATIDFSVGPGQPRISHWHHRHDLRNIAFAVLPDRNHTTVKDPRNNGAAQKEEDQRRLGELILAALGSTGEDYDRLAEDWGAISEQTAKLADDHEKRQSFFGDDPPSAYFHQYMQVVMRVVDDHGNEVADYFIEFSDGSNQKERDATEFFHTEVLESVKRNSTNAAYRCFFIDRTDLLARYYPMIPEPAARQVVMSISAAPPGGNIAYFGEPTHSAKGSILAHRMSGERWLRRNQTHYIEIIIPRTPRDEVFRLRSADEPFEKI